MTATAESHSRAPRADRQVHPASIVLGALLLLGGLLLVYAGRHLTFFYDEWTFVLTRRGSNLGAYLAPHNGHFVLVPVLIYKLLFAIVGLRHYTPYRIITVLLHLLSCGLLYALVRPRVGPWLALVATALLLFMGSAWQILLWPFQMGYLASVAGGLAALVAIERSTVRRNILAAVSLTIAVASSGVGIPFVAASAVVLQVRRAPARRYLVIAAPLVVFAIWYVGWSTGESTTSDAVLSAPQYIASAAAGAIAGIAGLDLSWGPPLLVGLAISLVAGWRLRADRRMTAMILAALAGALAFWGLAAITRADALEPAASRYLYVGAVFILLLVSEVAAGLRVRGTWAIAVILLAAGAVASNLHLLRSGERGLRTNDVNARSALSAVELAAHVVAPSFIADPSAAPQVPAGPYLAVVHDLGSPAYTLTELAHAPQSIRLHADATLIAAERLTVIPMVGAAHGTRPVTLDTVTLGHAVPHGLCTEIVPGSVAPASAELAVRPGTRLVLQATARAEGSIQVRRLASLYPPSPVGAVRGGASSIAFPLDRAPGLPWHVRLSVSKRLLVCAQ